MKISYICYNNHSKENQFCKFINNDNQLVGNIKLHFYSFKFIIVGDSFEKKWIFGRGCY